METFLLIAAWYAAGLIPVGLFMEYVLRRDGVDIKVGYIFVGGVLAAFGPLILVLAMCAVVASAVDAVAKNSKVIFPARRTH